MTDTTATPPAAPVAAPVAPPAAPATAPASEGPWYGTFTDPAVRDHATTKAWATPEDAVRSNLNLEKLIGVPQDRILKLPQSDAPATEWAPIYDRLGRPAKAEDYKLDTPAGADANFTKQLAEIMHSQGLTLAQAQAIAKAQHDLVATEISVDKEKQAAENTADQAAMRKEQGAAYDKYVQVTRQAAQAFGLSAETINDLQDVMGLKGTMDFLYKIGSRLGEDSFVSSSGGGAFNGAMTPAQAQARINALKADGGFTKKYIEGDVGARNEMQRLHELAVVAA